MHFSARHDGNQVNPDRAIILLAIIWMKRPNCRFYTFLIVCRFRSNVSEGLMSVDKNLADVANVINSPV